MKIIDISQEIFNCDVYPGDTIPQKIEEKRIVKGDGYNLTSFSMCAHNGTHIDAPFHFFSDGNSVDTIPLNKTVGYCAVVESNNEMDESTVHQWLNQIKEKNSEACKRILIKGESVVNLSAARAFSNAGVDLVGVESQSVGPIDAPAAVHRELLQKEIVLLEGLRLNDVKPGIYFLCAAPLSLGGADGAPCRALLIEME